MCQLNIFCVPKSVDKSSVLEIMKDILGYQVAECIDDENPIPRLSEGYSFYISGGMRCNCDSVLCRHFEDAPLTWAEIKAKLKAEQLEKLYAVKKIMEEPDYEKKRAEFEKRQTELWEAIDKTTAHIGKIESELADSVFSRTDISDEEKERIMREEVSPKIDELMRSAEETPEYRNALKEYQLFSQENQDMWHSVVYSLVRTNPETSTFMNLSDFLSGNDEAETFEQIMPSNCIYDAIENAEKESYDYVDKEYQSIYEFIKKIISLVGEIKILCYWQDGTEPTVETETALRLTEFDIDKCVTLRYGEFLTLTK